MRAVESFFGIRQPDGPAAPARVTQTSVPCGTCMRHAAAAAQPLPPAVEVWHLRSHTFTRMGFRDETKLHKPYLRFGSDRRGASRFRNRAIRALSLERRNQTRDDNHMAHVC